MNLLPLALILALRASLSRGLYANSVAVRELTDADDLQRTVVDSHDLWFVQFYVNQSPHCKRFVAEYERAAVALKGYAHLAAVNVARTYELIRRHKLVEFPTVKLFDRSRANAADDDGRVYDSELTASALVVEALRAIRKRVDEAFKRRLTRLDERVAQLHDDNYERAILNDEAAWLIVFYDVDGDATAIGATLNRLQAAVDGTRSLRLGAVGSDNVYARSFCDVAALPSVVFLPFGVAQKRLPIVYEGATIDDDRLLGFLRREYARMPAIKPSGLVEVDDAERLYALCDRTSLCAIVFLPGLKTFSRARREFYYDVVGRTVAKYRGAAWTWLWCEYGRVPDVEIAFGVAQSDEPSVVAVATREKAVARLDGPFDAASLAEFLENARVGAVDEERAFVDDIFSDAYEKDEL